MEINNWFEQPANYKTVIKTLGISQDQYLSIINSVKNVFPSEWVDEALAKRDKLPLDIIHPSLLPGLFSSLPYNPVPGILRGGPFWELIRLGQLIHVAENEPNVNEQKLFERLRGKPDEYMSALFELEVLETFKAGGFLLKKPMEEDGVDFTFEKNNKEILIEVSHRGASWILDLVYEVDLKAFSRFSGHSHCSILVKFNYESLNYLREHRKSEYYAVVEEITDNLVNVERGFSEGFENPEGYYSIDVDKSKNHTRVDHQWHDPTDLAYDSEQLLKSKIEDQQKLKQLLRNPGSYCAVDMRSLMPAVIEWEEGKDSYDVCSKFLKRWCSCSDDFFNKYPSVGGIFIWVRHARRSKDLVVDEMDPNDIILVNAPDHLSEEEALQLFPFAKLPNDLCWYHANLR